MPRETDVPGWKKASSENLIAPAKYRFFNAQELALGHYISFSSGNTIVIEVVQLKKKINAFLLYCEKKKDIDSIMSEKNTCYTTKRGVGCYYNNIYVGVTGKIEKVIKAYLAGEDIAHTYCMPGSDKTTQYLN